MLRLEGGGWKSANTGNLLAAYPTARPDLTEEMRWIIPPIDSIQTRCSSRL
jgi:hypothetical protein